MPGSKLTPQLAVELCAYFHAESLLNEDKRRDFFSNYFIEDLTPEERLEIIKELDKDLVERSILKGARHTLEVFPSETALIAILNHDGIADATMHEANMERGRRIAESPNDMHFVNFQRWSGLESAIKELRFQRAGIHGNFSVYESFARGFQERLSERFIEDTPGMIKGLSNVYFHASQREHYCDPHKTEAIDQSLRNFMDQYPRDPKAMEICLHFFSTNKHNDQTPIILNQREHLSSICTPENLVMAIKAAIENWGEHPLAPKIAKSAISGLIKISRSQEGAESLKAALLSSEPELFIRALKLIESGYSESPVIVDMLSAGEEEREKKILEGLSAAGLPLPPPPAFDR